MTPAGIREEIMARLGWPQVMQGGQMGLWTQRMNRYIYEGILIFFRNAKPARARKTDYIDTVDGTRYYPWPTDMRAPITVSLKTLTATSGYDAPLQLATLEDLDALVSRLDAETSNSTTQRYFEAGLNASNLPQFGLVVAPTASTTDGIEVRYWKKPATMRTVGDNIEVYDVSDSYHMALAKYAAAEIARSDKKFAEFMTLAQIWSAEFQQAVTDMKEDESEQYREDYEPVVGQGWVTQIANYYKGEEGF